MDMDRIKILSMVYALSELRISAIIGDELVGVASLTEYGSPASTIYGLYVAPEWRKKGIGKLIVSNAEKKIQQVGGKAISAIVDVDGPLEWWLKRGLKIVQCENGKSLVAKELKHACI